MNPMRRILAVSACCAAILLAGCRGSQSPERPPVLLIGIDGMEWNVMLPMLAVAALYFLRLPLLTAVGEFLVEADERCRLRPDEASRIYRVWEEARKALTVQAWTEQEGTYLFEIMGYERDLDPKGEKVDREQLRKVNAVTSTPIRSVPVEDLVTHGFVRPLEDGGHEYFGPDAEAKLANTRAVYPEPLTGFSEWAASNMPA